MTATTRSNYSPESFVPGPRLIDGGDFAKLFNATQSYKNGIVALAGGGQTGATLLTAAMNQVDTVASANDSVSLPPAIPGLTVVVINNTANAMQVFGVAANAANGGVGDTIAIQGSTSQVATGTGISQLSGVKCAYYCTQIGQWQQGSVT